MTQQDQVIIKTLSTENENLRVTYLHIEKLFPKKVMKCASVIQLVIALLAIISQVSLSF